MTTSQRMTGSRRWPSTRARSRTRRPGPWSSPIYQPPRTSRTASAGSRGGYEYSRGPRNPTRAALEECLAALEGGARGAGVRVRAWRPRTACCAALCRPGTTWSSRDDAYGGTFRLFAKVLRAVGRRAHRPVADQRPRRGARPRSPTTDPADLGRDPDQPAARHRRHRRARRDRARRGRAARRRQHVRLAVPAAAAGARRGRRSCTRPPSTWAATPTWSAARWSWPTPTLAERLAFLQNATGAVAGPVRRLADAARHQDPRRSGWTGTAPNAARVADMLAGHPAVAEVLLPGPARAPGPRGGGQADARLRRHGVVPGRAAARRRRVAVCGRTRLFTLGESLGGVESLIEHPGRMTHASVAGLGAGGAGRPGPAVGRHRDRCGPAGGPAPGAGRPVALGTGTASVAVPGPPDHQHQDDQPDQADHAGQRGDPAALHRGYQAPRRGGGPVAGCRWRGCG